MNRSVRGLDVVVVGLGASGLAAARLCVAKGARSVVINDHRPTVDPAVSSELTEAGVSLVLGGHPSEVFAAAGLVVLSPGVPPLPAVAEAAARGVPVVGEVELASWWVEAPIVGITGTNGKSTVTTLVGLMLEASGFDTFTGGNLGTPLAAAVGAKSLGPGGRAVIELSSYQLDTIVHLRPHVAVLLNLTPDHLDRYGTMAAYGASKARVFLNQKADDHAVVPGDDPLMVAFGRAAASRLHTFGGEQSEVRIAGDDIVDAFGGRHPLAELRIRGLHNVGNAMAATLAAGLAGATSEAIGRVLRSFEGLAHRMQRVAEVDGVEWFDDSKATNVGAAVKALEGVERTVVLIAGGRHKGGSYDPMVQLLRLKARAVVTLGEAAPIIEAALGTLVPWERASSMDDAVERAASLARPGDCVLLAPACSSFDMFRSYAERGDVFAAAVRRRARGSVGE